jgi:hypothetical protein
LYIICAVLEHVAGKLAKRFMVLQEKFQIVGLCYPANAQGCLPSAPPSATPSLWVLSGEL